MEPNRTLLKHVGVRRFFHRRVPVRSLQLVLIVVNLILNSSLLLYLFPFTRTRLLLLRCRGFGSRSRQTAGARLARRQRPPDAPDLRSPSLVLQLRRHNFFIVFVGLRR